jgi:hypothetical protein
MQYLKKYLENVGAVHGVGTVYLWADAPLNFDNLTKLGFRIRQFGGGDFLLPFELTGNCAAGDTICISSTGRIISNDANGFGWATSTDLKGKASLVEDEPPSEVPVPASFLMYLSVLLIAFPFIWQRQWGNSIIPRSIRRLDFKNGG